MKKIVALAAAVLLALTSCSGDDAQPTNPGNNNPIVEVTLLKKEITTHSPTVTQTMLYNYNAVNQLERIDYVEDGGHIDFTYINGLIAESRDYSGNDELQFKETFEYDSNNRLSIYKFYHYGINDDAVYKSTYTYNPDGTVTRMRYIGDAVTQTEWNATNVYTFSGGNIVYETSTSPNTEPHNFTMTYDTKNSPYKNIPGYEAVLFARGSESYINNRLTINSDSYTATSAYEYNSDNYPVSMLNTSSLQQNYSIQYFYE